MCNLAHFKIITFETYANSFGSEIIIETYSKNSPFVLRSSCDVTNPTKYSAHNVQRISRKKTYLCMATTLMVDKFCKNREGDLVS